MKNKRVKLPPPSGPATQAKVDRFLHDIEKFRRGRDKDKIDDDGLRDYLNDQKKGTLESIARRILMDFIGSPAGDASEGDAKPPRREKPRKTGR